MGAVRRALAGSAGSVSAEFAVLMPAVLLVLAFALSGVQAVVQQARLTDAAADGARSLARGDAAGLAESRMVESVGRASVSTRRSGEAVCVELGQDAGGPAGLVGLRVTGSGCALTDSEAAASAEGDG